MKNKTFVILLSMAGLTYALSDLFMKYARVYDLIQDILDLNPQFIFPLILFIIGLTFTFLNKIVAGMILARYPLGLTQASVISIIIILNVFLGYVFFGENIGFQSLLGVLVIMIGIIILTTQSQNDKSDTNI
jgi:multidrug transporter EmrE-like cation transporter